MPRFAPHCSRSGTAARYPTSNASLKRWLRRNDRDAFRSSIDPSEAQRRADLAVNHQVGNRVRRVGS
jgi:hypothetical protein